MYIATICFLGLAAWVTVLLAGWSLREQIRRFNRAPRAQAKSGQYDEATWNAIKAAWSEWCSYHPERRTIKQILMISWGRTFALCAVLCVIGICLEAQFGGSITDEIFTGFLQPAPPPAMLPAPPSSSSPCR